MNSVVNEHHHSVLVAPEVNEICQPLFQQADIVNYVYARVYDNHTCYALVANAKHHIHHFENQYSVSPPIPAEHLSNKIYYFLTGNENMPFQQSLHDAYNLFQMTCPFFIIERHYGCYDLHIFFSSNSNSQIINFYLNNIDALEKFNLYFKDKAQNLLVNAQKNLIDIPLAMRPTFGGLTVRSNVMMNPAQLLTAREQECVNFLSYSYTMKEIAKNMKISPRTVEDYLNSIKYKLGVNRKSEIIKKLKCTRDSEQ